jgi:catechol 2,3-dioxygenase-like lactoylglutathione lyase family enzyme
MSPDSERSEPELLMSPLRGAEVEPLLAVADVHRSVGFWTSVLGGVVEVSGDTYAVVRLGDGRVHLATQGDAPSDRQIALGVPDDDRTTASAIVVLTVDDCGRTTDALQQRGLTLLAPAGRAPWGGETRAFATDPDGHLIEFTSTDA